MVKYHIPLRRRHVEYGAFTLVRKKVPLSLGNERFGNDLNFISYPFNIV